MPIYDYLCEAGHRFDRLQSFSDEPLQDCEVCGKAVHRVLHAPAVHFKGKGFYATDYGRGGKAGGDKSETGSSSDGASKESSDSSSNGASKSSDSKSSDSKSSEPKSSNPESSSSKASDSSNSKPAA
jgi:putative FmdB family regulatory protein